MTEQEQMLTSILHCRRLDLYVDPPPLEAFSLRRFQAMKRRREKGEPLQYILGSSEFMGIELKVNRHTFIPRPETELLVENILNRIIPFCGQRAIRILDLGTGSGNIAVSLAKFLKESFVTAVDISKESLKLAKDNAQLNGVSDKINFILSDMFSYLSCDHFSLFDVIVSNPPYIARDQLNLLPMDVRHEPPIALEGGEDGLDFYRKIIGQSHRLLKKEGLLALEMGAGQRGAIETIFRNYPEYNHVEFLKDYSKRDRMVMAQPGVKVWKN